MYDDLLEYLDIPDHIDIMAEELKSRNVQCMNFYDIVLDYILIDSFEVKSEVLKNHFFILDFFSPGSGVTAFQRSSSHEQSVVVQWIQRDSLTNCHMECIKGQAKASAKP